MPATTLSRSASLSVVDYRCSVGPGAKPFPELYHRCCVSYVRKGSFGYRYRGEAFELVAGSILVGRAGDEYLCTHDHVCGDECLSFQFGPPWSRRSATRPRSGASASCRRCPS